MIDSAVGFDIALVLIVLVGAGLIARPSILAAHRRRGRAAPMQTPPAPDGAAAWTIDRALKALAASAARERVVLPPVVAVTADGAHVGLKLATPTSAPPTPWAASDDGTLWTAGHDELQAVVVEQGTRQPAPGLVTLGITLEGRMLLDLDQARGVIAIQGEPTDRHDVVRRLIREFTTNPWSASAPVLLVGLEEFEVAGTRSEPDLDDVLAAIAAGGRGIALLRDAPVGQRGAALVEALAPGSSGWSVIVTGTARYARWRFTAERDGRITSDFFPEAAWPVRAAPELATA